MSIRRNLGRARLPGRLKLGRPSTSGLSGRLLVAVPGVILAIALIAIGGPAFTVGVAVIAALALYEFYGLMAEYLPLRWAGYAGVLVFLVTAHVSGAAEAFTGGVAALLILGAVAALRMERREEITLRVAVTVLGGLYIGAPLATLVLLRGLPDIEGVTNLGAGAVVNVVVGTWVFDTASYLGGKTWGTRPIAPVTSPRKTVEGFVAGLIGGVLAVWVAGLYMDWLLWYESLALGVVICLAAFAGDLFESLIKRDVGVKDSGRIMLSHGGVLDRFDALLFSAPAAWIVTAYIII